MQRRLEILLLMATTRVLVMKLEIWKKFSNVMDVKLSELEMKLTGTITKHGKQVLKSAIYEEKIETLK